MAYYDVCQIALSLQTKMIYASLKTQQGYGLMFPANKDYELTIQQIMQFLANAGLRVMRTFDLTSACGDATGMCPHHGTNPCDCRLTILIVFSEDSMATLTAHRCDGAIWFALQDEPQQPVSSVLEALVTKSVTMASSVLRV